MHPHQAAELERRIDVALGKIRTLLDNTRHPQVPAEVPHRYEDKYLLAEFLTRAAVAGVLQCLESAGLGPEGLARLRAWAKERSVTLRLDAHEDCTFVRETTRKVESPTQHVTEIKSGDKKTKITDKVVTTVTEFWWSFEFRYELLAFQGTATDQAVRLRVRTGRIELVSATKAQPRPRTVVRPPLDANITWLLQHVDAEARAAFAVDRMDERCHTPRRNPDVEAALGSLGELAAWCSAVESYFRTQLFPVQQGHGLDLAAIGTAQLFSPVVPLFEGDGRGGAGPADAGGVLPAAYLGAFLEHQMRALAAKCEALFQAFPSDESVITAPDAGLLVTLMHAREVCHDHAAGVDLVEAMLRAQLIAAIGKELTPSDFADYMTYHHRKLFRPAYRPLPFSYAVRRPDHDPEGTLSLEARVGRPMPAPIATIVKSSEARRPMRFPLDASTQVSFLGERHLHAWVAHSFSGSTGQSLTLVARARQFSSYILMIGRIASADAFEPRHAVIVQNKDLLEIPLLLEQIPTAKEFRDAIESLSPEQQRFARSLRGMQLESTLFAVCVVQIKPQLEKLLRLPPDSLTKEIQLTQDLLTLFMEHQIPSDLLSYDGPADAPGSEKLERVRSYVARMHATIDGAKQKELDEAQAQEAFRRAEANMSPFAGAGFDPFGAGADAGLPMPPVRGMAPPGAGRGGSAPLPPRMSAAPSTGAFLRTSAPLPAVPASAPPPPRPSAAPPPPPSPPPPTTPTTTTAGSGQPPTRPEPGRPRAGEPDAATAAGDADGAVDYTQIPVALDRRLEQLDEDSALRPTIINPGDVWSRTSKKSLLAEPEQASLDATRQKAEKAKAFDLMDALSKSGSIPFADASLHVVIAATHGFDDTLLETVIQRNVNPIERVEVSSIIVATTIHDTPALELMMEDQRERVLANAPRLAGTALGDAGAARVPTG